MSDPLLAARGLACARGGRLLVSGLDLDLTAGGALVVTGANGSGKSSLIRCLAGLLRPFAGRVIRRARVALADERPALDMDRPLERALADWARLDGAGRGELARALDALDLAPLAEVPVRMLSTGQRRRAGLARVAASGAPLWLLDEPLSGLDSRSIALVEQLLARHREQGGGVVIATHQPLALAQAHDLALPG